MVVRLVAILSENSLFRLVEFLRFIAEKLVQMHFDYSSVAQSIAFGLDSSGESGTDCGLGEGGGAMNTRPGSHSLFRATSRVARRRCIFAAGAGPFLSVGPGRRFRIGRWPRLGIYPFAKFQQATPDGSIPETRQTLDVPLVCRPIDFRIVCGASPAFLTAFLSPLTSSRNFTGSSLDCESRACKNRSISFRLSRIPQLVIRSIKFVRVVSCGGQTSGLFPVAALSRLFNIVALSAFNAFATSRELVCRVPHRRLQIFVCFFPD